MQKSPLSNVNHPTLSLIDLEPCQFNVNQQSGNVTILTVSLTSYFPKTHKNQQVNATQNARETELQKAVPANFPPIQNRFPNSLSPHPSAKKWVIGHPQILVSTAGNYHWQLRGWVVKICRKTAQYQLPHSLFVKGKAAVASPASLQL